MKNSEKGFSLIIVVIFMSLAALFVGYLMGNWLISFLIDDSGEQIAQQEQSPSVSQNMEQNKKEDFNNTQNNLTAPAEDSSPESQSDTNSSDTADQGQNQPSNQTESQKNAESGSSTESSSENASPAEITGGYGVQIGAFSNYNNAKSLKDKVENLGYEAVITDSSPHQVQVIGYETREKAEAAEKKLEAEGYNGFIVARE